MLISFDKSVEDFIKVFGSLRKTATEVNKHYRAVFSDIEIDDVWDTNSGSLSLREGKTN